MDAALLQDTSRHRCTEVQAGAADVNAQRSALWREHLISYGSLSACGCIEISTNSCRHCNEGSLVRWLVFGDGDLGASGRARSDTRPVPLGRCGFGAKANRLLCRLEVTTGLRGKEGAPSGCVSKLFGTLLRRTKAAISLPLTMATHPKMASTWFHIAA